MARLGGRSVPHLVFTTHYPYLYPTNLSALIGLRILTPYSLFDPYSPQHLPPFTLPIVKTIPRAPYQSLAMVHPAFYHTRQDTYQHPESLLYKT